MEQSINHSQVTLALPAAENKSEGRTYIIILAIASGLLVSVLILPAWLPGLVHSILGADLKAFWYISRATAIMSYLILWFSMVWGLLMTGRLTGKKPGPVAANDLHKFTSLFGLALGLVHGLLLLGDHYMHLKVVQIFLPFSIQNYRPTWVGLGQINLYLWAILLLSFYLRKIIGQKTWRFLHYLTFLAFAMAMFHGILSGTDTSSVWMTAIYWATGGIIMFLTLYRIFASRERKDEARERVNPIIQNQ